MPKDILMIPNSPSDDRLQRAIDEIAAIEAADIEAEYGYERRRKCLDILHQAVDVVRDEVDLGHYNLLEKQLLLATEIAIRTAIEVIPDFPGLHIPVNAENQDVSGGERCPPMDSIIK